MRGKTKRQCAKTGEPWEDRLGSLHYFDKDLKLHRDGGPAWVHRQGDEEWYQHGKLHRLDGPARTVVGPAANWIRDYMQADPERGHYTQSQQEWWVDGKCQRVLQADGLEEFHESNAVRVVHPDGMVEWYDGDGQQHRLDEPAIVYPDGRVEWWVRGNNITELVRQHCRLLDKAPWFPDAQERMIYLDLINGLD